MIYYISIEPAGLPGTFRITWSIPGVIEKISFESQLILTTEESQWLWQLPQHRRIIGEKLFDFLDGEEHYFQKIIEQADRKAEPLHLYIYACSGTKDWPFEIVCHNGIFLFFKNLQVHLVRCTGSPSDTIEDSIYSPPDRPLKFLFMASSIIDNPNESDFEREEEAIFQLTEDLAMEMDVEDSGSLEGLRQKLELETFDVVHLSGFAGIEKTGIPYFILENETGNEQRIYPDQLWHEALKTNPPQLLVLSGSSTAETKDKEQITQNEAESSFAQHLVEKFNVPSVLGWGRKVDDIQAIAAGKMLFTQLSRGLSIPDAVQRARVALNSEFQMEPNPAWSQLRLYARQHAFHPLVKAEQSHQTKPRRMTYIYLGNSRVKVLEHGFVGRRRQLQKGLKALKANPDKTGLLIMGTGGLGKSCLAGKICERFTGHTLIIIKGRVTSLSMETALKDAFFVSQDDEGIRIVSEKIKMTDRLTHLCTTRLKERNYLFILDDFEQNLENYETGKPGELFPESAELLGILLHYLSFNGKKSQLIITCRYDFKLEFQGSDAIEKRLEKIFMIGFNKNERWKKLKGLAGAAQFDKFKNRELTRLVLGAGQGNPRLMEWIDVLVAQSKPKETEELIAAIKNKQEEFVQKHVLRELLKKGGVPLKQLLQKLSIYRIPVEEEGVLRVVKRWNPEKWKNILRKGVSLSLVEFDQVRQTFQVTSLLREELLKNLKSLLSVHKAAFMYFRELCESVELLDPVLTEEWIYHALECGENGVASEQGADLVMFLQEKFALSESRRIGEWIMSLIEINLADEYLATLFNALGLTSHKMGDSEASIKHYLLAFGIRKKIYGEVHPLIAGVMNNIGEAWRVLGNPGQAIQYFRAAIDTWIKYYGEANEDMISQSIAATMNNLALSWKALGNYPKAIQYFEVTHDLWEKIHGKMHPNISTVLNNLGTTWHDNGYPHKAIEYYLQALQIDKNLFGSEHPNVALDLNNIGDSFFSTGNYNKAIDYFEQALNLDKVIFGLLHPDVARDISNLGAAYQKIGSISKSVNLFKQAYDIDTSIFGEMHPNVAIRLNNLGEAHRLLGDYCQAVDSFEKALVIDKKTTGCKHPDYALHLSNLGSVKTSLGCYQEAIDLFREALNVNKEILGPNHPNLAITLNNMGETWRVMGKQDNAIECFEKALAIDEEVFGKEHPNSASTINNIGLSWLALKDYPKALINFERAISIWSENYGDMYPLISAPLNNIGSIWKALGEPEKAIRYLKKACSVIKHVSGGESLQVASVKNNIGSTYNSIGKHAKAIGYYKQAMAIWEKTYGVDNHPNLAAVLNNIGMTYIDMGDKEQGKSFLTRARKIFTAFHGPDNIQAIKIEKFLGQLL